MDATHLHLILTHFPIVGTVIGIGILAYGQYSKNNAIIKVALVTFILMAIFTIPVYLTGEDSEETVEHIAGVSENLIENHEELAEKAILLMGLLAALSAISFFAIMRELSFAKTITLITLIVSFITFGVFAQVGNLGGQIRHSEIRANNPNMVNKKGETEKGIFKEKEKEHDDDDD
ncbi:MAG: hypothetical protein L3J45_07340 [Flavobacteriaceae bacterium]|nr:hypothetical protein [Flavobacteriaceae bacterium]